MGSKTKLRINRKLRDISRGKREHIPTWLDNVQAVILKSILFILMFCHQISHNFMILLIENPTLMCYKMFRSVTGPINYEVIADRLLPMIRKSGYTCSLLSLTGAQKEKHYTKFARVLIILLNVVFLIDYFGTKTGFYLYLLVLVSLGNGCLSSSFNEFFLRMEVPQETNLK